VPGLGVSFGRGAATTFSRDVSNSDVITIMGSNMAECHPVAFRWVMKAKENGAKLIHIDPRFTRTSAMADIHAPIRTGSDIAFLGGLINWLITNERYFKDYVVNYTNAATIITPNFKDTEELEGVFSGYDPQRRVYENTTWQYDRTQTPGGERAADPARTGEAPAPATGYGFEEAMKVDTSGGRNWNELVARLKPPPARRDPTLQDPNCVFQILKRHYARYTPEMVERVTGCPKETFLRVAETMAENSGPERTGSMAYAVAWTQHTYGVQIIRAAGILQQLLGNIGRPGGGILALRGHATIQGSTDNPTLYHSITGYMSHPSIQRRHESLKAYLATETTPTSFFANQPKYMVSYLKATYGEAATAANDYGYDWHPKISGDHSHMAMMDAMYKGTVKGFLVLGQNPATSLNAGEQRKAMAKLDWMVVRDYFLTETATFWDKDAPEIKSGELNTADIKTEVFFLPAAHVAEMDGSFTQTHRLLQWHEKAADPPGDARSDVWFSYHLGKRLKALYANSNAPRDQGIKNLLWDYEPEESEVHEFRIKDEPSALKILKEINGYNIPDGSHLKGFGDIKDDGTTICGNWIYTGCFPAPDQNLTASRKPDTYVSLGWGFNWPANRHIMYNRASARPDGTPWSERKKYVWWDGSKWTGYDVPDFAPTKPPNAPARPDGIGLDAQSGTDPFIMKADGKAWLFAPSGLVDGPLPAHYEPVESVVPNLFYKQQNSPVYKHWDSDINKLAQFGDPRFPYIITTYRLTEHHLSGTMSRWLPWLAELQPELFIEMSPELAAEKGINNLDWVTVTSARTSIRAKALVTPRMRPFMIDGKRVHHVGMPWHWGYRGIATGDVVNNLTSLIADPNVSMHEGKSFIVNVEKA
jgi:formate dehydrogenase major subunit